MKMWKKNVIAAAVLVTVCTGIFVNWKYSESKAVPELSETLNEEKILSPDLLVMQQNPDSAETTADSYFSAVRLSRQEARDSALSVLQEAMAYSGETEKDSQASAQLEDIVQTALCEAQIESLVIAKGYEDCVTYISEEGVSVAVAAPEGGLQQEDVAVIADIVLGQSSQYGMEDIRVIEVQ